MELSGGDCCIISGGSGALGVSYLPSLEKVLPPGTSIILLTRNEARLRAALPPSQRGDISRHVYTCDITDEASLLSLVRILTKQKSYTVIHAAADVSWSKSFDDMYPVNVGSTLNLGMLADALDKKAGFIYVSTAFTHRHAQHFNNAYEKTKHLAEVELSQRFPSLNLSTFSFSLMIGARKTGEISRFHGIYPLLKIMALYNPPFFVGAPDNRMDLVPIDWVVDELTCMTSKKIAGQTIGDVVISAGEHGLKLSDLATKVDTLIGGFRRSLGLEANDATPIISRRRYDFLKRSVKNWETDTSDISKMLKKWNRVANFLAYYTDYLESCDAQPIKNPVFATPEPETYIDAAFDYWLQSEKDALTRSLLLRQ